LYQPSAQKIFHRHRDGLRGPNAGNGRVRVHCGSWRLVLRERCLGNRRPEQLPPPGEKTLPAAQVPVVVVAGTYVGVGRGQVAVEEYHGKRRGTVVDIDIRSLSIPRNGKLDGRYPVLSVVDGIVEMFVRTGVMTTSVRNMLFAATTGACSDTRRYVEARGRHALHSSGRSRPSRRSCALPHPAPGRAR